MSYDDLVSLTIKAYARLYEEALFRRPVFGWFLREPWYIKIDWTALDWFVHPLRSLKRVTIARLAWKYREPLRRIRDAWSVLAHGSYLE